MKGEFTIEKEVITFCNLIMHITSHLCCTLLVTNQSLGLVHTQMEVFQRGIIITKKGSLKAILDICLSQAPSPCYTVITVSHELKEKHSHLPLVHSLQPLSPQKQNLRRKQKPLKCVSMNLELRDF